MKAKKYLLIGIPALMGFVLMYYLGFYPVSNLSYQWQEGDVNSYHYEFSAKGEGHSIESLNNLNNTVSKKMDIQAGTFIKGGLDVTTLSVSQDGSRIKLLYHLQAGSFKVFMGESSPAALPKFINMLVTVDKYGRVLNFEMPETVYKLLNSSLAEFISLLELPLIESNALQWKGVETSFSDVIPVEIFRLWQFPFSSLQPLAKDYLNSSSGNQHSGSMLYELNVKTGVLNNISGFRFSEYYVDSKLASKTQTQFNLQHYKTSKIDAQTLDLEIFKNVKTIKDNLQGVYLIRAARLNSKRNVLGNDTAETLFSLMGQIDLSSREARTALMQKLFALMILHPESVAIIGGWLAQYEATSAEFRMLVAVLSGLGTPEAQSILVDIMQASADGKEVMQILPNLGLLKQPTVESENYVRSLKESSNGQVSKNMADLTLGAMAKHVSKSSPERAEKILNDKEQELAAAQTNDELKYHLRVIGNMGLADQYEIIEPYFNSDSNDVRAQAVDALRFVGTEEAANTLIEHMADEDEDVRLSAVGALAYRNNSDILLNAFEERLYSEKKTAVVRSLLSNIGGAPKSNPKREAILKSYISRCGITVLCDQAKKLL